MKKFFGGQLFALYVLYCKYVVDHEIVELFPTYRRWGGATGMGYIFGTLPLEILKAFFQIDLSRSIFLSNLIVYVWCLFFVYSVFGIQKLYRGWNLKK